MRDMVDLVELVRRSEFLEPVHRAEHTDPAIDGQPHGRFYRNRLR